MKTKNLRQKQEDGSALMAVLIFMLVVLTTVASLTAYVTQTVRLNGRRADITSAIQFAQGGSAIGAYDLNKALTNSAIAMAQNLTTGTNAYTYLGLIGTASQYNVFERTMAAPFSNQSVTVQIHMTNSTFPTDGFIRARTTVRDVTQETTLHVKLAFGFGAAIVSDNAGTTGTGVSKSTAQDGNVVVNGGNNGSTIVDGGQGLAIWANGRANVDAQATVPSVAVLAQTYGTGNQIPDYTADGSVDQLFDFARFIAVADLTPLSPTLNPAGNNHFTNLTTFLNACTLAAATPAHALEGVVVVNITKKDADITPTRAPNGINIRGTLIFYFSSDFSPTDKIINTSTMNINAANLSGLVASDPTTYPTGYPPTYYDSSKKPSNIDISGRTDSSGHPFVNFSPADDLPALMYNVGILDIHGNANICGVVYSPSFMEIENKQDNQIQYFKGSLIGGGGIYFENGHDSTSICSYDPNTLDLLATSAAKGKRVIATYWE